MALSSATTPNAPRFGQAQLFVPKVRNHLINSYLQATRLHPGFNHISTHDLNQDRYTATTPATNNRAKLHVTLLPELKGLDNPDPAHTSVLISLASNRKGTINRVFNKLKPASQFASTKQIIEDSRPIGVGKPLLFSTSSGGIWVKDRVSGQNTPHPVWYHKLTFDHKRQLSTNFHPNTVPNEFRRSSL
jgi:hypothetical protein